MGSVGEGREREGRRKKGRGPQGLVDTPHVPNPEKYPVRVTCDVGYLWANFSLPRSLCSRVTPDVRDR